MTIDPMGIYEDNLKLPEDYTHGAVAEWAADQLADTLMFVQGLGWHRWSGDFWRQSDDVEAKGIFRELLRKLHHLVVDVDAARDSDARKLRNHDHTSSVMKLTATVLYHTIDEINADPDILATPGAYVHLPTGATSEPDPTMLITKCTAVAYNPGADRTKWHRALAAVPEDAREWLQVVVGQSITGYTSAEDKTYFATGGGSNGKSTVFGCQQASLGSYAGNVPDRIILGSKGGHTTEFTDLQGMRFGLMEELPEGRYLDSTRIKKITGTQQITARRMRQDDVTFNSTHTLFITSNYTPAVAENDHGTWRRLCMIPFPFRYGTPAEAEFDRSVLTKDTALRRELLDKGDAGALAWAVEGARKWFENGMKVGEEPISVQDATLAWQEEKDLIRKWMDENCVLEIGAEVRHKQLFSSFNDFLKDNEHQPWTSDTFTSRFRDHEASKGLTTKKPQNKVTWVGIRLKDHREKYSTGEGPMDPFETAA